MARKSAGFKVGGSGSYQERKADRDREVAAFTISKDRKRKQNTEQSAEFVRQDPSADLSAGEKKLGQNYFRVVRGASGGAKGPVKGVAFKQVAPAKKSRKVAYSGIQGYSLAPRPGTPNIPMSINLTTPVGAFMVFVHGRLVMTMPYVASGPLEMKRLFQMPKGSPAEVRIHTGVGTLQGGEAIQVRRWLPPLGASDEGVDWNNLPRDLNDVIGKGLQDRLLWWWDSIDDKWDLLDWFD